MLFLADLLHPVDALSLESLGDRDVGHRYGGRRAMPMLLTGRDPDHVARAVGLAFLGDARRTGAFFAGFFLMVLVFLTVVVFLRVAALEPGIFLRFALSLPLAFCRVAITPPD